MSSLSCLNCGHELSSEARFCPACGQKAQTRRLTLHDIAHESWHALTHTDHSVLSLIKALLLRPGLVAREFALGQRKRYFNPFSFLVVAVALSVLVTLSTGIGGFGDPKIHPGPVGRWLNQHLNLFLLAQVPLLALWARLIFLRSGMNLAENLVLAAYGSGLRSLFILLLTGLLALVQGLQLGAPIAGRAYWLQVGLSALVWTLYFGWACAQFHRGSAWRWRDWLRGMAVALLTQATSMGLLWVAFYLSLN